MMFVSAAIIAAAVFVSASIVAGAIREAARRDGSSRAELLGVTALFAPGIAAAAEDPRTLLAWQPLAETARKLFPEAFEQLDRASGGRFPFTPEHLQAAHARWSADWLAWERAHDAEFKLKAAAAEAEMAASGGSTLARARADAVEREKLELYQRRYSEYVRVSKALQALIAPK
jgi:hypothetical protein